MVKLSRHLEFKKAAAARAAAENRYAALDGDTGPGGLEVGGANLRSKTPVRKASERSPICVTVCKGVF